MAETLKIDLQAEKKARYQTLLPQLEALIAPEDDLTANLANVASALRMTMGFFWVGFYRVQGQELVLAPFQGDIACTRIRYGRGVCGTAWAQKKTILVPAVEKFEGHIACSSLSKSEIVVPIFQNGEVVLILDVDSDKLDDFEADDQFYLEQVAQIIEKKHFR
ncbi:GAF domain-containing protein [Hugenholtzia roseola]|uniref:GAF domain-containing protein n=1 Tax=Hugenholtzia roseola TaxID=1002 RepID=UPI000400725A|nr:GAF domain-containing protein [Hugenholtzia roseola]